MEKWDCAPYCGCEGGCHVEELQKAHGAEIERLRAVITTAVGWCEAARAQLGAMDGYDYRSGEEFGIRRAQLVLEKLSNEQTGDKNG